ncbi:hypothetical protein LPMP_090710 [Leishmania panamensis]|uniref:Uncharacterized protein n=1 Tax=Leishmania panamensis TaxID=5679 RepID=A0A088RJ23_LEIPA|nr:hypothetical protein LPMP_090710 [Leishmania panamensis]AIN95987.1 hypothetical protein LPMP_090710 [Leishmania panamensis]
MRPTCACAVRAVRMYAPMRVAATNGATPSAASLAGGSAAISSEVRAARRITEAVLRARANRKLREPQPSSPPAPVPPPAHAKTPGPRSPASERGEGVVKDTVTAEVQTATRLALSYGKSAFMTHLVHQHDKVCERPCTFSASEWDQLMVGDPSTPEASAVTASSDTFSASTPRADTPSIPRAAAGMVGLQRALVKCWDELTDEARVRWITSTPQGRRALQHATKLARFRDVTHGQCSSTNSSAYVVPSMELMLSKYKNTLVQPRLPRAAALAPSPRESTLRMKLRGERDTSANLSPKSTATFTALSSMMHVAFASNASRHRLRDRADAVRREERRKLWHEALVKFLGGEAAFMFVHDVKYLQQPRAELDEALKRESSIQGGEGTGRAGTVAPSTPAAAAAGDTALEEVTNEGAPVDFSDGLLDLCEDLGIRSARRAYVLSRVLPEVDATSASEDPPLSLAEVRDLAKRCSNEYNDLRAEAARTAKEAGFASAEDAVRAFERVHLALAVARVQAKLHMFQENLPLLKNCVNALSK